MKVVIEYGKAKNLITIHGVKEILELPFGYRLEFTSESNIVIAKDTVESMEILPND